MWILTLASACILVTPTEWDRATDRDRDGHVAAELGGPDCDDAQGAVNPDAPEICGDAVDNDCDGQVDDDGLDARTWHVDLDADGYGDPEAPTVSACSRPDGYVNLALAGPDCDDDSPAVSPAALEVCGDGVDNDCDTAVDDDGLGTKIWYPDLDQDGYTGATAVTACTAPARHTSQPTTLTDCNDGDGSIHPGATEVWYDGRDQDCDGGDDFDRDQDGFRAEAFGGDDCADAIAAVNPDATEVCNNRLDDDCDGTSNACELRGTYDILTLAGVTINDDTTWDQGDRLSTGDVNGDGRADLLITGYAADQLIFLGPLSGSLTAASAATRVYWNPAPNFAPTHGTIGGDLDGDGRADLAVGAHATGELFVFYSPLGTDENLVDADVHLVDSTDSHLGYWLAAIPDQDGDGADELAVGAPKLGSDDSTGEIYVFDLLDAPVRAADAKAKLYLAASAFGRPSFTVGSVTSVGVTDILAMEIDDLKRAFVIAGPFHGSKNVSQGPSITVPSATSVAAGDIDGDGLDEIAVSSFAISPDVNGVFILETPIAGTTSHATARTTITASATIGRMSPELAMFDLNGDGLDDLVITATQASAPYHARLLVFYAPIAAGTLSSNDADITFTTATTPGLHPIGADLNHDGILDLATPVSASRTVVVFGRGL